MRMNTTQFGRARGFTLIEVMVVIAIIAALIGTGSVMLSIAGKKRMISDTQGRMNGIGSSLDMLHAVDQMGRYPPSQISKMSSISGFDAAKMGGQPNATNSGIEAVYVAFKLPGMTVPVSGVDIEGATGNTDDDKAMSPPEKMKVPDLFEYLDAWGNPFIYFSASDYKDPAKVAEYVRGDGTKVTAKPHTNEQTKDFLMSDKFQLFSMGPDGQPNTDDDLMYGKQ